LREKNVKTSLETSIRILGVTKKVFLFGLGCCLVAAATVQAQSPVMPLTQGSQWRLQSPASSVTVTVDKDRTINGIKFVQWTLSGGWGQLHLLLSVTGNDINFEGLVTDNFSYRYPTSIPLFPAAATPGQNWQWPLGRITAVAGNLTAVTKGGTYTGCSNFRWDRSDGSTQSWTMCPTVGPAVYADASGTYTLANFTLKPAKAVSQPVAAPCPALGVASIPNDPSLTLANRDAALQVAVQNNARFLDIDATWAELEPTPGNFQFARIRDEFTLAQKYGLEVVFTLKLVNNNVSGLPPDLATLAWNNSQVVARLQTLLIQLLPQFQSQLKWVNLGYEVDGYFLAKPLEIPSYGALYSAGRTFVKSVAPAASVGIDFAFDSVHQNSAVFQMFSPYIDHVAFDYYAQDATLLERPPASLTIDIPLMVLLAAGKPVILKEVGYSSGIGAGSSPDQQRAFMANLFAAIQLAGGTFKGASVWAIQDMPASLVEQVMAQYGIGSNAAMASFLGTLGLQDLTGTPKPAWSVYTSSTAAFLVSGACQTPAMSQ
jgi:hypothetical protein